jgi:hypothetical protein
MSQIDDPGYADQLRSNFQRMEIEELLERARSGTLTQVAQAIATEVIKSRGLTEGSSALSSRGGSSREDHEEGPKGVGGWLLLLVVGLTIGPVVGAGRTYAEFLVLERQYPGIVTVGSWNAFKLVTLAILAGVAVLGFYAAWGLARGTQWSVVLRAQIILWAAGPLANVVVGLVPTIVFNQTEPAEAGAASLLGSVIVASVWTAYLAKSKRVRATYARPSPSTAGEASPPNRQMEKDAPP